MVSSLEPRARSGPTGARQVAAAAPPRAGGLAPFALTALAAWVSMLFGTRVSGSEYAASLALLALSWTGVATVNDERHGQCRTVAGALAFLAALGLARNATGGTAAAVSVVALLPVLYIALHVRDRRGLWLVLAGLAAFYLVPLLLIGGRGYPASDYRTALLMAAISAIAGLVTHGLVGDVRARAEQAQRRELMLARVSETIPELYLSADPRHEACLAVRDITQAQGVGLYEPDATGSRLIMTRTTGTPDAVAAGLPARVGSAADTAMRTRHPQLIRDNLAEHVGNVELWRADGCPASVLYQPLLKGDEAVGVLVVSWSDRATMTGPRVAVAALLAHEIAAVIDRVDVIDRLTDEALTDPLTGLANRRAWDVALDDALAEGHRPVTVAIMDLDHFKAFNDRRGHPAGDDLLRATAAAWRTQLRAGDLLARIGGEEFGLLLSSRDASGARGLVARLMAAVPSGQTCSVGLATSVPGDAPQQLLERADAALYDAKASGRNRVVLAQLEVAADGPNARRRA